jgi:hypothetical protein
MLPRTIRTLAGAALFALGATAAAADAPPAWMAGCWQGEPGSAAANAFEAWSAPRAGRMLGISQTLRGARSVFEYMRIEAGEAGLRFIPQPGGKPPVEFAAETVEASRIVFANPQHDFPKYVEYQREGDRLTARLGAQPPGADGKRQVFAFRRVPCDTVFSTK